VNPLVALGSLKDIEGVYGSFVVDTEGQEEESFRGHPRATGATRTGAPDLNPWREADFRGDL
jgi:hypothetical protein